MPYDALRRGRCSLSRQIYSVTTVTRDRVPIFNGLTAARLLVRELRRLDHSGVVDSLAWVVMPDHLHWLLQLNGCCQLSHVIKSLKACSALAINNYHGQQGSLWQQAYYDRAARKEDDVCQLARYIIANPLRAGLVEHIGDYPHWDCIWLGGRSSTVKVK
jgi:REP element-mobilizing transposase RayT